MPLLRFLKGCRSRGKQVHSASTRATKKVRSSSRLDLTKLSVVSAAGLGSLCIATIVHGSQVLDLLISTGPPELLKLEVRSRSALQSQAIPIVPPVRPPHRPSEGRAQGGLNSRSLTQTQGANSVETHKHQTPPREFLLSASSRACRRSLHMAAKTRGVAMALLARLRDKSAHMLRFCRFDLQALGAREPDGP